MRLLNHLRGARLAVLMAVLAVFVSSTATTPELRFKVRTRVEIYKGSGDWHEVAIDEHFFPSSSALILCDMWDNHWCQAPLGGSRPWLIGWPRWSIWRDREES